MPVRLILALLVCLAVPGTHAFAQYTASGCLSADEELLAQLVNDYRIQNGLPAVPVSATLTEVAQWHVADHNYAQDVSGDYGNDPTCNLHTWYGMPGAPYSTCCYTSDHAQANCMWQKGQEVSSGTYTGYTFENAAMGYTDVASALDGWKNSSGHNDVILNQGGWSSYTWLAMGVGVDTVSKRYFLWFSYVSDPEGIAEPCGLSPVLGDVALALAMKSVYPNPFNPRTSVSYEMAESGNVRLSVFDVAGRLVRTLVNTTRDAGVHTETWNGLGTGGKRLASGTYFFRLETAAGEEIRKVTLTK